MNIPARILVPAVLMLLSAFSAGSCTSGAPSPNPMVSSFEGRHWYRQAVTDLGARIVMTSVTEGVAISRGSGREVKGKAYRFKGGQWVPFQEFPYSDYPQINSSDPSAIWTIHHLTHDGAYRPVLTQFNAAGSKKVTLPAVMWDEIDHVMFKGLHRFPDGTAWMVGQQGHILYYNGSVWKEVKSPLINPERSTVYEGDLNDIVMTSKQTGWAVGRNGIIVRFASGAWNVSATPTDQTLQKLSMINDSTGWAVGNSGTILQCRNFQWTNVSGDVRDQLMSVTAADTSHAWIVGNNSTLLVYDGTSWQQDASVQTYDDYFSDISVVKDSTGAYHCWIIGNTGIYTTYQSIGFSFTDVTEQEGLRRIGRVGHFFSRSDAVLPDLLVANDGGTGLLYEKSGSGPYADVTGETALLTAPKDAMVMALGDVNNDGEEDILQLIDRKNFRLFLGTSGGGFRDFSERSGLLFDEIDPLNPVAAKFIDLNNDGDLDLYISNHDLPDQLFTGDGTGRFFRYSGGTGINKILQHASYGAVFGDFNNDRLMDLLIPYYVSSRGKFFSLFLNNGGMRFSETNDPLLYAASDISPTAAAVADVNNDGSLDLFIHSQKVPPILWLNDGNARFMDVSAAAGFTSVNNNPEPINGIVGIADVNNDGWVDIFDGSKLHLNDTRGRFTEVSERAGIQFIGTPSFSDADNDGDQDMFIGSSRASLGKGDRAAFFRNNLDNGSFIKVTAEGDRSNRSAIGARIVLTGTNGMKQTRIVGGGGSQLTTLNLNEVHFGVAPNDKYTVTIVFPSGLIRTMEDILPGTSIRVTESGFFLHQGITAVRSLIRTAMLLDVIRSTVFLVLLALIIAASYWTGKKFMVERLTRHPLYIGGVIVTFGIFIHLFVYEGLAVAAFVAAGGTSAAAAAAVALVQSVLRRRDARYIGHFRIVNLLGSGGMGKVYKAVDTVSQRTVALKVLNPELLKDPENRRRLTAEGQLLSSFEHQNIVKVFEIGESEERGYIAMEFLSGGTLREMLEKEHPLSLHAIKQYLLQICDGLSEVHTSGIIHRDLKTGNVMLHEDGTVRIMDFGLSKSPLVTTMTTLGTVLGTLGYVAPEQVTGLNVDQRTDIFSFGVLMYELLTNELPFKGENEIALIHSIFNTVPPAPSEKRPDVPKEWDAIVMKCLSKDPNERFNSLNEIAIFLNT